MTSILNWMILLTLFLIPLLGATGSFGYEYTKVLGFIILTSIAAVIWLVSTFKHPWKYSIPYTAISKTAVVFILILLLTSISGLNSKISLFGTQPYFQGFMLYLYLLL